MEIEIGGRKIPLMLTTFESIAIQEEIGCTVAQIRDHVLGIEFNLETDKFTCRLAGDTEKLKLFGRLIRILGNAGLEEAGEKPDLMDKWVLRHIPYTMVIPMMMIVWDVVNDAMKTEIKPPQDGPVDEGLEEENRKKERES